MLLNLHAQSLCVAGLNVQILFNMCIFTTSIKNLTTICLIWVICNVFVRAENGDLYWFMHKKVSGGYSATVFDSVS